tara:strand:+ start:1022 stop:1255 length:234 start_codon:yes stop_codon:yes gene_type:complete
MSKQDDQKFIQQEVLGKQDKIVFTNDFNKVSSMSNSSLMFVAVDKDGISSGNPTNDEIGLYAKFGNRTYKVSLSEVS